MNEKHEWRIEQIDQHACGVRQFTSWANVRAKQFHASDNGEIAMKIEIELVQDSIQVNENRHLNKSMKQHSHKRIHKKR